MTAILLRLFCAVEAATGLALLSLPALSIALLLGADVSGAGIVVTRIAGIALLSLAIACWPSGMARGLLGMTAYNVGAGAYMTLVGLTEGHVGMLWWPAVAAHVVAAILLARALFKK